MTSNKRKFAVLFRRSGVGPFVVVQLLLLSAGLAWGAVRWQQLSLERKLPELRQTPIDVRPTYDNPLVVSDEQLTRVLNKLRPKKNGPQTKINHVDHALRFWTAQAKFADPAYFSGEEMRQLLTDNRRFAELYGPKAPSLLIDVPGGGVRVRVQEGQSSSSHFDHTMAGLAEVGTSLDYPVVTPMHKTTYRAMIEQALRDFQLNQIEYEWTSLAMILYLPPNGRWIDTEGQEITFDRLAKRLMREEVPRGVCFGNHRLHTLAMFLRVDDEMHVLSPTVRSQAIAYLMNMTALLVRNQHSDGYWDGKWPTAKAADTLKDAASGDAVADRILATGHALEWWAFAPKECHPPRETIIKAGQWLVHTIDGLTPEQTEGYYTYLSHAGRALACWRGKLPYQVPLE